ncbi:MAG: SdrD B-like domain-containing protein [Candidatus Zixiibacteriota bacterium]
MNTRLLTVLCAAGLYLLAGCSNDPGPVGTPVNDSQAGLHQAGVPSDATINSAKFYVHATATDSLGIDVHRITSAWTENTVSWNNIGAAYAPTPVATLLAVDTGCYSVDVTSEAQGWLSSSIENLGFALLPGQGYTAFANFNSREAAAAKPFLEVCYTTWEGTSCDTFLAVADAHIFSALPDNNAGMLPLLIVQRQPLSGSVFKTLIRFDFEVEFRYSSIGDRVWNDRNADGLQSDAEPGLAGVSVKLFDCQDNLIASSTTDEQGLYHFESVMAGSYYLVFVRPDGYFFTLQDSGSDDALDSDVDPSLGRTLCFTLLPEQEVSGWDAGLYTASESCTYSKGYWKNHAGFGPQDDVVTPLLPLWLGLADSTNSLAIADAQTAVDVLSQNVYGDPSNGITKLYAQLLAAKLNIANGADPADIAQTVGDADSFLGSHDWTAWETIDIEQRRIVLGWKDLLDQYNNGLIGPGHCDSDDDDSDDGDDSDTGDDDSGTGDAGDFGGDESNVGEGIY